LASHWSITQSDLAGRPQPTSSSHGLSFPTARAGSKVHLPRTCQPAAFHLQGLATLLAVYALRSLAGFVSHRQRSWDSPFGAFSSRKVSGVFPPGRARIPFLLSVIPSPKRQAGPDRPRFPGFSPSGSPWPPDGRLIRQQLDAPLGFSLPGLSGEGLRRDFARRPLTRFAARRRTPDWPASQSLDQPSLGFVPDFVPKHGAAQSNPLRVPAPHHHPGIQTRIPLAMCSPILASCITADRPMILGEPLRPTGVAGTG